MSHCTMGVGCDEAGICYANAHGKPEECPRYKERPMEEKVEITESQLAEALAKWEKEAIAKEWPNRTDPDRHSDNAKYLISLMQRG